MIDRRLSFQAGQMCGDCDWARVSCKCTKSEAITPEKQNVRAANGQCLDAGFIGAQGVKPRAMVKSNGTWTFENPLRKPSA